MPGKVQRAAAKVPRGRPCPRRKVWCVPVSFQSEMGTEKQTRHADVRSVTELLMHDMRLTTIAQARLDPWMKEGCWTIGHMPCTLRIHRMRNTIAVIGVTAVFTTKKWRLSRRYKRQSLEPRTFSYEHPVHRKPYQWQRGKPEQEEVHKVPSISSRRIWIACQSYS